MGKVFMKNYYFPLPHPFQHTHKHKDIDQKGKVHLFTKHLLRHLALSERLFAIGRIKF